MDDDKIFESASRAVLNAKQVIAKAEAALLRASQFERENGLSKEAIEKFLTKHLSATQRRELDAYVEEKIRETHEAAEKAVSEHKKSLVAFRPSRIKMHI